MAFPLGTNSQTLTAEMWNQFAGYFNGSSSYEANPMQLITMNDSVNYVQSWKNLDTTNGRVVIFYKADGTVLARITKDGFRFSPDGVTPDLVPASLSGTETFTGSKTFNNRVTLKRATSTASAAALTLPTDGNQVPISGTTPITSIVATGLSGLEVTLEFATAGAKVTAGATLKLEGDFWSAVTGGASTLTLYCDGTNWIETARSHATPISCALNLTTSQEIADDAWAPITWLAPGVARNVGPCWAAGSPTLLSGPVAGLYLLSSYGKWESNSTGRRRWAYELNSDGIRREWNAVEAAAGIGNTHGGSYPIVLTAGQSARIMVRQNSGSGLDVVGGTDEEVRASLVLLAAL